MAFPTPGNSDHVVVSVSTDFPTISKQDVLFHCKRVLCKRVLEAAKLEYITSQKLDSWEFWRVANSGLSKGKAAIPPLFNSLEVLFSASDKVKLFAKYFPKNSNLDDSTNINICNSQDLDSSKVSGPDCIPMVALKNCEPELSYILADFFNMSERVLFSRLLEGLIGGPYI